MKNKYTYFILKMVAKMLIGIFVAAIIVAFALYLHSNVFAWDLYQVLEKIGVYDFVLENKILLICLFFSIIVIISFSVIIFKFSSYLSKISNAVEQIFLENVNHVELPVDLIEIEDQLNSINSTLKKRNLAAKESEQRKNDLIVYLAHDLKTPLASVIGYLNLLEQEPDLPVETRAKYIGISLDRALRLEDLINELFDITKFNLHNIVLSKSQINLSVMLRQIIEEFYPIFNEHILTVEDSIDSNLILCGDGDKLARIFDNLIRNAVNYSYAGTVIYIKATKIESNIVITFTNTGDMIPSEKLLLIFEKFYRVDSSRSSRTGGSGLGLAVAKEISKLHGGDITATSDKESTCFTVTLPVDSTSETKKKEQTKGKNDIPEIKKKEKGVTK